MIELKIGEKIINDQSDAFIIAELGHNHQGKLSTALEMIKAAKECGCDAVKLQKRNNKTLFTSALYNSPYDNENSFGLTYGEHREVLEFGEEEYKTIMEYAKKIEIICFATPFDFESANFLERFNIPCYKTASGDLKNIPLLKYIAEIGKPMFISTGGGMIEDVQRAYDAVMPINRNVCLMQCTASYPIRDFNELGLRVIQTYQQKFDCVIGLSAHDVGISMAVVAYTLGARVIEKHFTLNRTWKGTDHAFSLEPTGMKRMVRDLKRTREALGDGIKRVYESEKKPLYKMGKGLYFAKNLPKGHSLINGDIDIKSPANEVPPYLIDKFMGLTLIQDVKENDHLKTGIVGPIY